MDGEEWHEEWDSWDEIANRVVGLFQFGIDDSKIYSEPYQPSDSQKVVFDGLSNFWQGQVTSFRKIYNDGFVLGKKLNGFSGFSLLND